MTSSSGEFILRSGFGIGTNPRNGEEQFQAEEFQENARIVYIVDRKSPLRPTARRPYFVEMVRRLCSYRKGETLTVVFTVNVLRDATEHLKAEKRKTEVEVRQAWVKRNRSLPPNERRKAISCFAG